MFFKSEKLFSIAIFWKIFAEQLVKSEKLLRILIKLLDPQTTFHKSESGFQIQESSIDKSRKTIFEIGKKYFVTCYLRQQSAGVRGFP